MYCPQCRVEYRPGFTRCTDCDVDLVYQLPITGSELAGASSAGSQGESDDDPFCSFWRGDDPRIHAEICELLNEEGIPHKTIRREDHLFNLNSNCAFEIGIPFSQFEKAEATIQDAYGTEEEQKDVPRLLPYEKGYAPGVRGVFLWQPLAKGLARAAISRSEETENDAAAVPEEPAADDSSENWRTVWDPMDWNPEDASIEVWSSEQSYPGEIIELALRENQIHARPEKAEGKNAIFVLPEDEIWAREIVREVVEGTPPA